MIFLNLSWNISPNTFRSHVCMFSCFDCVQLFETLWTVTHQAPLSMGFSRQEYWSRLPCPSPGDLPDPGKGTNIKLFELTTPALASRFFTHWATWEAHLSITLRINSKFLTTVSEYFGWIICFPKMNICYYSQWILWLNNLFSKNEYLLIRRPLFIIAVEIRLVVLNQKGEVILLPRGNLKQSLKTVLVVITMTGGDVPGISQGCCWTSCHAQDSPTAKNDLSSDVNSATVEKA